MPGLPPESEPRANTDTSHAAQHPMGATSQKLHPHANEHQPQPSPLGSRRLWHGGLLEHEALPCGEGVAQRELPGGMWREEDANFEPRLAPKAWTRRSSVTAEEATFAGPVPSSATPTQQQRRRGIIRTRRRRTHETRSEGSKSPTRSTILATAPPEAGRQQSISPHLGGNMTKANAQATYRLAPPRPPEPRHHWTTCRRRSRLRRPPPPPPPQCQTVS